MLEVTCIFGRSIVFFCIFKLSCFSQQPKPWPHWFCLPTRWRKETGYLVTKIRSQEARHHNQFQTDKKCFRAGRSATSQKLTPLISAQEKTQSDDNGQENPSHDRLHYLCVQPSTPRPVAKGSAIRCPKPGESRPGIG